MRNPMDARSRDLERRAEQDPAARVKFFRSLRQRGDFNRYVTDMLLADFRKAVAEDQSDIPGGQFGLVHREAETAPGFGELLPGLSGTGIFVPDFYDRPEGLHLSVEVGRDRRSERTLRRSSMFTRVLRGGQEGPESNEVLFTAALSQGPPVFPPLHPFHFWLYNGSASFNTRRDHPLLAVPGPLESGPGTSRMALPARFERTSVLVRELDEESFRWALGASLTALDQRLELADRDLAAAVRYMGGKLDQKAALRRLHGDHLYSQSNLPLAIRVLQALPGPVLTTGPYLQSTQAWNLAGTGMAHGAMVALARYLTWHHGARPHDHAPGLWLSGDPYSAEGSHFASADLVLTSTRARRTRTPLHVGVRWDGVNNAWREHGDRWIGNQIAPQGEWQIHAAGPKTVAQLGEASLEWIVKHFPRSTIEFSSDLQGHNFRQVHPQAGFNPARIRSAPC